MKKHLLFALSVLILRHNVYGQSLPTSPDREHLQGLWQQSCANQNTRAESIQDTQVTLTESFFVDPACTRGLINFINEGVFTLPAPGQIDFQFTSLRVRLLQDVLVEDFNLRAVCGLTDWKLNEEKEISGRLCEIFGRGSPQKTPAAGEMRYGIYHLEDDRLLFGRLSPNENATTPEKRPTVLDPRYYSRVPHALSKSLLGL